MRTSRFIVAFWIAVLGFGSMKATCAPSSAHPPAQTGSPAPGGEDIRDIRGPEHLPYPWLWIVYTVVGLAAAGSLYAVWRAWKNRRSTKIKLPHERALERLMAATALMTPEQTKDFSIAVSDAVRGYIEQRFQVKAARRTTEEFLHDLLGYEGSPLAAHSKALEDFLKHCDLAKFAQGRLSVLEMQSMHGSACRFVEETRPIERETVVAKSSDRTILPKKGA